jgi:hypothetical protein
MRDVATLTGPSYSTAPLPCKCPPRPASITTCRQPSRTASKPGSLPLMHTSTGITLTTLLLKHSVT